MSANLFLFLQQNLKIIMSNTKKWLIALLVLAIAGVATYFIVTNLQDKSGGLGISSKDAVCMVDGATIKDAPGKEGAFVAALKMGEKLKCIDEKEIETQTGLKKYYKVELSGGESGWIKESNIITAAKPAAIVSDAIVYGRPDLVAKSSKMFSALDIVAVKQRKGDFVEVYGRTKLGKKVKGGWIKLESLTFEDVDVAVAIYVAKANKKPSNEARIAALKEIVENPDFSNSRFIAELTTLTSDVPVEPVVEDEEVTDTTATTTEE